MKAKGIICFQETDKCARVESEVSAVAVAPMPLSLLCRQKAQVISGLSQWSRATSSYISERLFLIVLSIFGPDTLTEPDTVTTAPLGELHTTFQISINL